MDTNNETNEKKSLLNNWLVNTLIGTVLLLIGIMYVLFPKMLASVGFIIAGVMFLLVGITDTIAAIKYKTGEKGFNGEGISGILSIAMSIFFVATFYMPNITTMTIIYIICIWGILRCVLMLISVFSGRTKRKGTILSALVSGVAGVLLFLLRDVILSSGKLIGIIILVVGALFMLLGLYQRADAKGKREKELAEKQATKKAAKLEASEETNKLEQPREATDAEITKVEEVKNE